MPFNCHFRNYNVTLPAPRGSRPLRGWRNLPSLFSFQAVTAKLRQKLHDIGCCPILHLPPLCEDFIRGLVLPGRQRPVDICRPTPSLTDSPARTTFLLHVIARQLPPKTLAAKFQRTADPALLKKKGRNGVPTSALSRHASTAKNQVAYSRVFSSPGRGIG